MAIPKTASIAASQNQRGKVQLEPFLQGLLNTGRINQEDLQFALKSFRATTNRDTQNRKHNVLQYLQRTEPGVDRLAPEKNLDLETLTMVLSQQSGQSYYRIDPLKIDVASITEVMSYAFTQRHGILAVQVTPAEVTVASAEPYIDSWEGDLAHTTQRKINRVVSSPADIRKFTTEFYSLANSINRATEGAVEKKGVGNLEQLLELGNIKEPEANDQHIVNVVDWLLQYAFEQRASDIHIEPRREKGNIRFRIDGVLYTVYALPMQALSAVTSRLKILGRMNVAEKRKPQDGRIKTKSPNGEEIELRLSTLPTAFGEKLVMRIFDPECC